MAKFISLLCFIALVGVISALSSMVTIPAVEGWYRFIQKPFWNPPNNVFGPVWTVLYVMIAFSGWRAWQALPGGFSARFFHPAMRHYWLQLAFNFFWSFLFFEWKLPVVAAVDIIALVVAIGFTIRCFYPLDKWAAYLLVPYLLWVSYASTLNIAIAILN